MNTCPICITKYNNSTCAKVVCACDFECCRTCAQTYLLSTIQEPHCMQCRNKWSLEFVKHNLGASFVNGALKEHQTKIITEKSLAKREELMPLAIEYKNDQNDKKKIAEIKEKMAVLREQLNEYQDQINDIENIKRIRNGEQAYYRAGAFRRNYRLMMNGMGGGAAPEQPVQPVPKPGQKFIMPCQNSKCNGMLNNDYCCELCDKKTCSKCLEVENENHECNPDSVESAKLLRSSTKPCPKCGTRISKIDGCDQMWCVECKTAFSWGKGTIETTNIHNPHYFEYMRKNNIEVPRNPYDRANNHVIRCESRRDRALRFLNRFQTEVKRKISEFIRYVNHIQASTIADLNTSIEIKTNNVQPLEIRYILGELTKEELSEKLMANHKYILKDQAFKDIYSAIVMMGDQLCDGIDSETTEFEYREIFNRIMRFTAYFNMELIKALMLHDSKRTIEMYRDDSKDNCKKCNKDAVYCICYYHADAKNMEFNVSYKSKKEMLDDLHKFSEIYK